MSQGDGLTADQSSTQARQRTIVDEFVKRSMLQYFALYPTRMHVLVNLFFSTGHGCIWADNGEGLAVPEHQWQDNAEQRIKSYEEEYPDERIGMDETHQGAINANVEFQRLVRDWARRNINLISTRSFHFGEFKLPEPIPPDISSPAASLLATLPGNVHPDWLDAVAETCDYVGVHINMRTLIHGISDEPAKVAFLETHHRRYLQPYLLVKQTTRRFQEFPHWVAREAKAKQIIDAILAESANDHRR